MTQYTDDQLIAAHVRIRKTLDAEEKAWDERRKQLKTMMQSLEGVLNARILAMGGDVNSIRTESGTVFNKMQVFAAVKDKDELRRYVLDTQDFSFVNFDVSRNGVLAYMKEHDGLEPPGIRTTRIIVTTTRET